MGCVELEVCDIFSSPSLGKGKGDLGIVPFGVNRLSTGGRNQPMTATGLTMRMVPRRKYQKDVPVDP